MIDQALLSEVQYAVLEPVIDGGQTWGSEVWTRAEVLGNLNSAIWALLRDTHLLVARVEIPQLAAANGVVPLPADWMATAAVVWRTAGNTRIPLGPIERFEGDLALPTWEDTADTPIGYDEQEADTLTLQLLPKNLANGTVELLYIARPAALQGAGATIPVPEEICGGIKYSLIGMLLRRVDRLVDAPRAAYCEQRYDLAVTVTKILLDGWA